MCYDTYYNVYYDICCNICLYICYDIRYNICYIVNHLWYISILNISFMFNYSGRKSYTLTTGGQRSCQLPSIHIYSSNMSDYRPETVLQRFAVEIKEQPRDSMIYLKTELNQSKYQFEVCVRCSLFLVIASSLKKSMFGTNAFIFISRL